MMKQRLLQCQLLLTLACSLLPSLSTAILTKAGLPKHRVSAYLKSSSSSSNNNNHRSIQSVFQALIPRGGGQPAAVARARIVPASFRGLQQQQRPTAPGKATTTNTTTTAATTTTTTHPRRNQTVAALSSILALCFVYLAYDHRTVWLPLFDKEKIQQTTLDLLRRLQPEDVQQQQQLVSKHLLLYAAGIAVWELMGLSTIPVESAAGMAFGWKGGIYSFAGKLLGASMAFVLGRYVLAAAVSKRLQRNEIFQLINGNSTSGSSMENHHQQQHQPQHHHPLLTAFLMKFSCFPEAVKNFGSSLLSAIAPWMFLTATVVHGGSFTLLWTWLGVDTARQLNGATPTTTTTSAAAATDLVASTGSRGLQVALVVAFIVGVVLTPLAMAWWVRDLKRLATEQSTATHQNKNNMILQRLVPRKR